MKRLATSDRPGRGEVRRSGENAEAQTSLELMRMLQIVEEARANLADQYDYAPIGFMTLDAAGMRAGNQSHRCADARARARRLLRMPFLSHSREGTAADDFLHHLRECRRREAEVVTEVALRTRGGAVLPVELRSVPVLDPRGGGTVFRTAITSIAERLRASVALRESEQRHRDLVELSPDGIFIQRDGSIAFANRAALVSAAWRRRRI